MNIDLDKKNKSKSHRINEFERCRASYSLAYVDLLFHMTNEVFVWLIRMLFRTSMEDIDTFDPRVSFDCWTYRRSMAHVWSMFYYCWIHVDRFEMWIRTERKRQRNSLSSRKSTINENKRANHRSNWLEREMMSYRQDNCWAVKDLSNFSSLRALLNTSVCARVD
jgi:hypothetical protein